MSTHLDGNDPGGFSRKTWLLFCLVFWGFPFILTSIGFRQIADERSENRRQDLERRISTTLSGLTGWVDTQAYLAKVLRAAAGRIFRHTDPEREFVRVSQSLKQRFPGLFEFTYLDGGGNVVASLSDGLPPRRLLHQFMKDFCAQRSGDRRPLRDNWPRYQPFFGILAKDIRIRDQVENASLKARRAFVFASTPTAKGMFIVHLNRTPDWDWLGLRELVNRFNRRNPFFKAGVFDVERRPETLALSADLPPTDLPALVGEFDARPQNQMRRPPWIWGFQMVNATFRLLCACPDLPDPMVERSRLWLIGVLGLLFGGLSWGTLLVMTGRWRLGLSIRIKLILVFAYTAGLPLTLLGFQARTLLVERQAGLENQIHLEMEKALLGFDRKFPQVLGLLQTRLRKHLTPPLPAGEDPKTAAVARIQKVLTALQPGLVFLTDAEGESVFDYVRNRSLEDTRPRKYLKPALRRMVSNLNQTEIRESMVEHASSEAMAAVGLDYDELYTHLARTYSQVTELNLSVNRHVQAIFPQFDQSGKAVYLATFNWNRAVLERRYIETRLERAARRLEHTRWLAPDDFWSRTRMNSSNPYDRNLATFDRRLRAQERPMRGGFRLGRQRYLLTGIRGEFLRDHDLIAVTSDDGIRRELALIMQRLGWLSLGILLMSVTVAGVLARQFLIPVTNLSDGVAAIRDQRFDFRIPILDRDELGELSTTFNQMMEGLADLEVARVVQGSLFPRVPLEIGAIRVFGDCRPAAQVGGDYFDYFPIGQDRVAVLVGDVSGHGTGAAIAMAMAKAVMTQVAMTESAPEKLLDALNQVLLKTLRNVKMMTCFLAVIETNGHSMRISNAGHNFPFLVRAGVAAEIELIGFPLGKRAKRDIFPVAEQTLQRGDTLVFYTDGLVEAGDLEGEQIGYQRLRQALVDASAATGPRETADDPQSIVRRLRCWHDATRRPGPLEDDVTVVVARIG